MSFGFQQPWWLAALALALPLLWFYLRPRVRPPAVVSSLRIWRRAVDRVEAPTRKPKLPLLFFVQVALLTACALALSRPFAWEEVPLAPSPDAIVVLDISASMQAREQGSTRFEAARDAAVRRVRELAAESPSRRFTVIAAALQPRIVGSGLSADEAARALAELLPLDTAANLTAAVELAATRAGSAGSVDLFTDLSPADLVVSRDARDATTIHRFGTSDDNVAIVALEVLANPLEDAGQKRVVATVRNASATERTVELELAPLAGTPQAAGETKVAQPAEATPQKQTISLAPGQSESVVFAGAPWSGPFAARLLHQDALSVDDLVYGHIPVPQPIEVVLVSDDTRLRSELSDLARRAGRIDLKTISTAEWSPERARAITVFDRFVPTLPPSGNTLYLAPPSGNSDVTVTGSARGVRLAELRDHDLVRGLKSFDGLLVEDMSVLSAGGDLRPVALGRGQQREHALVLAGESGGRRVVATAFPLRAESLRRADGLSALLLVVRALRWLSPAQAHAPIERLTGERLRASLRGAAPIARLEGPDGARDLAPTEDISLERAGIYRALGAGTETPLLVSFIDPAESSIGRPAIEPPAPRQRPVSPAAVAATAWEQRALVMPFLLALLALLSGEWILLALRRFSGGKPASGGSHGAFADTREGR